MIRRGRAGGAAALPPRDTLTRAGRGGGRVAAQNAPDGAGDAGRKR